MRAEAEAVADAARERLRERDPTSRLAQSVKIIELEAGDHPAFAVGTDEPAGFFLEFGTARRRAPPGLCQLCTLVYRLLTMRSERLSRGFESVGQGLIMGSQEFALKGQPRHPIWLTVVDGETSR